MKNRPHQYPENKPESRGFYIVLTYSSGEPFALTNIGYWNGERWRVNGHRCSSVVQWSYIPEWEPVEIIKSKDYFEELL